jgi:hypothetical protein
MSIALANAERHIGQVLFVSNTPDGRRFAFAFLDDGRCAVLCNGAVEHACDGDETGVSAALERFSQMTHPGGQRADSPDPRPS